ncbi:MAG: sigma-70 family RNA polymerase sigma factor [Rhodoglobus sp.]|nr:sigma-70 family RNA polymerase sigma factor [Rhodoglobus sp.]
MPSRDEWIAVVQCVAESSGPGRGEEINRLYRFAMDEGRSALRGMQWVGPSEVEDLVHDKLHAELASLLLATDPRAYFCTIVRRAALDLRRKVQGKRGDGTARRVFVSVDDADFQALPAEDPPVDEALARRREAREIVARLSERELQVFAAIMHGEDRDDIAAALGTSRANVDQIVSRTRKRVGSAP